MAAAPDTPWPEHPRPDFYRPDWINLNGKWQFEFDPEDIGEKEQWYIPGRHPFKRQIVVPFPWESRLSGIGDTKYRGIAWYSREIELPQGRQWKHKNHWLVIGACDWQAKVWINGQLAAEHVGGYLPFDVNLSRFAEPGRCVTITIRAVDTTDRQQPAGKQIGWYTPTSGIWQTVYIEVRGWRFIRAIRGKPNVHEGSIIYEVFVEETGIGQHLKISSPDEAFKPVTRGLSESAGDTLGRPVIRKIMVKSPKLWTPDSPVLYPIIFEILNPDGSCEDRLESYFGLREISVGKAPGRDYQYIYLNGKPIYLRGALHQSFHPDGIYQYPDDAIMRGDYELCKRIGLNFLRIHIKAPVPRELYWADKLGVLIMQDMPNFVDYTDQSRKWWQETLEGVIFRDCNHPAIFAWCDFNETWGLCNKKQPYDTQRQQWVADMYHLTKRLDPTRLCEDNSACRYDHVVTDINSWHFYINDYEKAGKHIRDVVDKTYPGSSFNYIGERTQDNAPLINSEYGGIGASAGDQDISWCFKYLTNELRLHDRICGYVYTELTDIEWEHNGFVNYDRTEKEYGYDFWHPGFSLKDLNNPDFVAIDAPPMIELEPSKACEVPIKISHWSNYQAKALSLRWRVDWLNSLGQRHESKWRQQPATWGSYAVIDQIPIKLSADPDGKCVLGALLVELVDADTILARNYVNLLVDRGPAPRIEALGANTVALRFSPNDWALWTFNSQLPEAVGIAGEKVYGCGPGDVEYRLRLPASIKLEQIASLTVLAELAGKAGNQKLDWPTRKTKFDYPQTDVKKQPSDTILFVNGEMIAKRTLPDDPADARGALSHHHRYHPGSYGYLVKEEISGSTLQKVIAKVDDRRILRIHWAVQPNAANCGGLAIFGEKLGGYPVAPTVLLTFKNGHGLGNDFSSSEPVAVK